MEAAEQAFLIHIQFEIYNAAQAAQSASATSAARAARTAARTTTIAAVTAATTIAAVTAAGCSQGVRLVDIVVETDSEMPAEIESSPFLGFNDLFRVVG
jgi:hypothetical protein